MTSSSRDRTSVIEFFASAVLASAKMQTIKGGLQRLPDRLAPTGRASQLAGHRGMSHRAWCGSPVPERDWGIGSGAG